MTDTSKGTHKLGEGAKFDSGKPRMELLPYTALKEIAKVLTFGAKKYAAWNWSKGMDWSRLHGAAMRHLGDWSEGEDHDPDSGLLHLAHAGCCIVFLIAYQVRGLGTDDRHTYGREPDSDDSNVIDAKYGPARARAEAALGRIPSKAEVIALYEGHSVYTRPERDKKCPHEFAGFCGLCASNVLAGIDEDDDSNVLTGRQYPLDERSSD